MRLGGPCPVEAQRVDGQVAGDRQQPRADGAARSPSPIPSRRASSDRVVEGNPRSRTPDSTSGRTVEFNSLPQGDPDIAFIAMTYGWNRPTDSSGLFPAVPEGPSRTRKKSGPGAALPAQAGAVCNRIEAT